MQTAAPSVEPDTVRIAGRDVAYKNVVAVAFVLGFFMDVLDTTIVNVALPTLQKSFHADVNTIEWVVTGYLLSLALRRLLKSVRNSRVGPRRCIPLSARRVRRLA